MSAPQQFRVLFDFDTNIAEELSVREGEVLTLIRDDVGEGWLEVINAAGNHGLVPEGFVEPLPPSTAPPLPPPAFDADSFDSFNNNNNAVQDARRGSNASSNSLYRVTFDFESGHPDELSASVDEVLRVSSKEVGDGWWEAINTAGKRGLIPEGYLEPFVESPAAVEPLVISGEVIAPPQPRLPTPPPSPPPVQAAPPPQPNTSAPPSRPPAPSFTTPVPAVSLTAAAAPPPPPPPPPPSPPPTNEKHGQAHDNDYCYWTSDEDDGDSYERVDEPTPTPAAGGISAAPASERPAANAATRSVSTTGPPKTVAGSVRRVSSRKVSAPAGTASSTVGGGVFAPAFIKTGGEAYLLGVGDLTPVEEGEVVVVVDDENGVIQWEKRVGDYQVEISSPKKEAKFHGMKSYISYTVSPSYANNPVYRRYKHFDWLHKRLVHKYPVVAIPPLPDRQVTGRYEEEFIEGRMRQLQQWVDRMCRHPVISSSSVFQFFQTCDGEQQWKEGKRRAEADPIVAGQFFRAVTNSSAIDYDEAVDRIETFKASSAALNDGINKVFTISVDTTKKMHTHFKAHSKSISRAFQNLSNSLEDTHGRSGTAEMKSAIESAADAYNDIGDLHEEQPKHDWIPLLEKMAEQKGVLGAFPGILQTQAASATKTAELTRSEVLTAEEAESVAEKNANVARTVAAEIEHFEKSKNEELKEIFKTFLREQINYQLKMQAKLQVALAQVEGVPVQS